MNTVSVRTPRTAGAIGLVEVVGDLDALLTPISGTPTGIRRTVAA